MRIVCTFPQHHTRISALRPAEICHFQIYFGKQKMSDDNSQYAYFQKVKQEFWHQDHAVSMILRCIFGQLKISDDNNEYLFPSRSNNKFATHPSQNL